MFTVHVHYYSKCSLSSQCSRSITSIILTIDVNPFATGSPFLGTKLLGFSIGRGSGALKGYYLSSTFAINVVTIFTIIYLCSIFLHHILQKNTLVVCFVSIRFVSCFVLFCFLFLFLFFRSSFSCMVGVVSFIVVLSYPVRW